MATFTVTFTVNAPDVYTLGWREQGSSAAHTIETQTINTLGVGSFTITIPGTDNIYCDNHNYEGYIIARCQDQTVDPTTGVPLAAMLFTASFVQQTDPCPMYEIECDQVQIANIVVNSGSTGYTVGDVLTFTTSPVSDTVTPAVGTVATVNGSGEITTLSISNFGMYKSVPVIGVTSSGGSGASFTVQMSVCADMFPSTFACAGTAAGASTYAWQQPSLNESLKICLDTSVLGSLPAGYIATDISPTSDTCNCQACKRATVVNNSGKGLRVQWQTCNDGSEPEGAIVLLTQVLPSSATPVVLGCVIENTVHNLDPQVGTLTSITYAPC